MGIFDSVRTFFGGAPAVPSTSDTALTLAPDGSYVPVAKRGPAAPGTSAASSFMNAPYRARKGAAEVLASYQTSPTLRSAIGGLAGTVASVRWRLYAGAPDARGRFTTPPERALDLACPQRHRALRAAVVDGEATEIRRHPWLDLFESPNPYQTGNVMRALTVISYKLIGEAAWVMDGEVDEPPTALYPVPGTWILSRPTPSDPWWEIALPSGDRMVAPASRVVSFVDPDPANPYGRGTGIGMALADEVDIDEHAAKMLVAFFANQALPAALISVEGAQRPMLERMKREWNNALQGFKKAYRNHWTGGKIDVKRLDTAFKDMQLVELRKAQQAFIQQGTGRPPEKMGIVQNSNKATALAASIIDATDQQVPMLEVLRGGAQRVADLFDPRLHPEYENPIPADVEARRALIGTNPYAFTVDDVRGAADLDPLGDDLGGGGVVVNGTWFESPRDVRAAPAQPMLGAPDDGGGDGEPAVEEVGKVADEALNGAQMTAIVEIVAQVQSGALPKESAKAILLVGFPTLDEKEIDAILDPIEVQPPAEPTEGELAAALHHPADPLVLPGGLGSFGGAPAAQQRADGALKKLVASVAIAPMADEVQPLVEDMIEVWGQRVLDDLGAGETFDPESVRVQRKLSAFRQKRIGKLINATTRAALSDALREVGVRAGGPTRSEVREIVTNVFARAKVERSPGIATTESVGHAQWAAEESLRQTGLTVLKEWIATPDDLTRDSHAALDGQLRKPNEPFVIPAGSPDAGAKAQHPGGFGLAAQDINCRCALGTQIVTEDEDEKGAGTPFARARPAQRTSDERAALWRAVDDRLQPWEREVQQAVERGFDAQMRAVLAVVDDLFAD